MNITQRFSAQGLSEHDRSVRFFVFVLLATFLLILLLGDGNSLLEDPDTYWHITVGQRIWQTGSLPRVDEFSHTFYGNPWIANEWVMDLLMFAVYNLGGWRALVLLTACTIAATYALLYLVLSRELRLSVAVGAATVAYVLSIPHFLARPHVFAFPLVIIWFTGLVRAVETKTSPKPILLAVMVLWANIHGSFTLGLGFAGALAPEAVFDSEPKLRLRTAIRWAIFLTAALGAACATPYGYQPILLTFNLFSGHGALETTAEWQPMFVHTLSTHAPPIIPIIVLALLFLALYYGIKVPFWRLLQILALIFEMLSHVRLVPLFSIITPILLAGPLSRQFPLLSLKADIETNRSVFYTLSRASQTCLYPLSFLLVVGIAAFGSFGPSLTPSSAITPVGAVDYMSREKFKGNVYNEFVFGGYLIFRGIKTFIDGRTAMLFPDDFIADLNLYRKPNAFFPLLEKYDVGVALVKPMSIEADELSSSSLWTKVYSDGVSSLYVKK
jgi:hypothetical protein